MNGGNALFPLAIVMALALSGLSTEGQTIVPEHPSGACSFPFHVQHAGWDFCWQQDDVRAQGIELNQVVFQGEPVMWKIGFPFSITRYEDDAFGPFKDTLGRSIPGGDNPGFGRGSMQVSLHDCPRFLGQGTLLNDQRICVETRDGPEPAVAIWGRYDIFNYRFLQGYILDSRGTMEPFVRLGGLLIDADEFTGGVAGTNHFHHLYWRVDMDIGGPGNDQFQMFLRPHEDWRDWDPYWVEGDGAGGAGAGIGLGALCALLQESEAPPPCPGTNLTLVDPLAGYPPRCGQQVRDGIVDWCGVENETALLHHPALFTKWRVADIVDTNKWDHAKSYGSTGHSHSGVPSDGVFATFDALTLQYAGDSDEIGFNVPARPLLGDTYMEVYHDPPEPISDPVVWFAAHTYHDTRDEEVPTMSYHHLSLELQPRNLLGRNPGEDTYSGGDGGIPSPPGGIGPGTCVGSVCIG